MCGGSTAAWRDASRCSIRRCRCGWNRWNADCSSSLRLVPFALPQCGPGEVVIEVKAAGMNFRDVLKALALYPAETADARIFGDEVAGVVKAVGSGVTHV